MAFHSMMSEVTAAGLDPIEVAATAESIKRSSTMIEDGKLYAWTRKDEQIVLAAIAQLVQERDALARAAAGVGTVSWTNHQGTWCIKGRDLEAGQHVAAVRRDGSTQDVWVKSIITTTITGEQIATCATTKEA